MNYEKIILVTGGAGFIGSNFLNICVPKYQNYLFINIDALTAVSNIENVLVSTRENYHFEKVDITDTSKTEEIFKKYSITDIIHFAAETHVDVSLQNPQIFIETNINGTSNLLALALKYKIKRFYQVSTDEVYGSLALADKPFTTSSNLHPNNPYSVSKAGADLLVQSYHQTFGLDVIISRCTNNYGPHQDKTKFIPQFINLLLKGEKVPLYAKGENIRDWIYVTDHIDAIDLLFHKGIAGKVYNIGAGNEFTNLEITKKLLQLAGRDEASIEYVADRVGHDFRYALDTEELSKEFSWRAKTDFADGIKNTFEFYKNQIR